MFEIQPFSFNIRVRSDLKQTNLAREKKSELWIHKWTLSSIMLRKCIAVQIKVGASYEYASKFFFSLRKRFNTTDLLLGIYPHLFREVVGGGNTYDMPPEISK